MLNKKLPQISSSTPLSHFTQALKAAEKSLLAMFDAFAENRNINLSNMYNYQLSCSSNYSAYNYSSVSLLMIGREKSLVVAVDKQVKPLPCQGFWPCSPYGWASGQHGLSGFAMPVCGLAISSWLMIGYLHSMRQQALPEFESSLPQDLRPLGKDQWRIILKLSVKWRKCWFGCSLPLGR